jgi:hypothetical protein
VSLADVDPRSGHSVALAQPLTVGDQLVAAIAHDDQNVGVTVTARPAHHMPNVDLHAPGDQVAHDSLTAGHVYVDGHDTRSQQAEHGGHLALADQPERLVQAQTVNALDAVVVGSQSPERAGQEHQLVDAASRACGPGGSPRLTGRFANFRALGMRVCHDTRTRRVRVTPAIEGCYCHS